jgi:putative photosynthetic complex assembly protein
MNTVMNPSLLPRSVLVGLAALVLVALAAVSVVRLSGVDIHAPDAAAVTTRALRFEDRPDGSIAVTDATTALPVATITGQSGFVRGTLRGLARERKRSGLGQEQPFQLIGRADGRLTLHDPATGRSVDLESFGPVNAAEFARLLDAKQP